MRNVTAKWAVVDKGPLQKTLDTTCGKQQWELLSVQVHFSKWREFCNTLHGNADSVSTDASTDRNKQSSTACIDLHIQHSVLLSCSPGREMIYLSGHEALQRKGGYDANPVAEPAKRCQVVVPAVVLKDIP